MSLKIVVAVVLIALGVLALVHGGFTYTKERHDLKVGPMELEWKDRERVRVPIWVGIAAIAVGTAVLVLDRRGR